MQNNQLQRAINLSKKTGDRLIVFDSAESGDPYVVMNLDEYEKMVAGHSGVRGLTENELLDKINRDIAVWKSDNEINNFDEQISEKVSYNNDFNDFESIKEDDMESSEIEDLYKEDFSSPGLKEMHKSLSKKGNFSKSNWSIPSERKLSAEEVVEDDIEEDRQYLEELPF